MPESGNKDLYQEKALHQYELDDNEEEEEYIPHEEDDLEEEEEYIPSEEEKEVEPENHDDQVYKRQDPEDADDDDDHYSDFDEWLRPESEYIDDFGDNERDKKAEHHQEAEHGLDQKDSNTVNKLDLESSCKTTRHKQQRRNIVWNEHDEIAILNGILLFRKNRTEVVSSNTGEFHEFVRDLLQADVSVSQLSGKIRRLKEKYQKNARRSEHGVDPSFSNPHEETLFLLSKKIWGTDVEVDEDKDEPDKTQLCWLLYPRLSESLKMEEFSSGSLPVSRSDYVKAMLSYIGRSKAQEFEEKWRKLQVAELR